MEVNVEDITKATNTDLWLMSYTYLKIKNYKKLFPCLDEMENRIPISNGLGIL